MPIIATAKGDNEFPTAPAGTFAAVCVDVVDLGMIEVSWQGKEKRQHKIRIAWQIDEQQENGKPFLVSKRYTLSLHEKAALRKDLESWRGRSFTEPELEGFDVEALLGIGCYLCIVHTKKDGKTWANINAIMRFPKGVSAPVQRDYMRVKDRPEKQAQPDPSQDYGEPPATGWNEGATEDDVPF